MPDARTQSGTPHILHVRRNRQQWVQVFFSDESRFTLHHNEGRLRVWRHRGERFIDATVQEKMAVGGGSIMASGAFNLHHRSPLYLINGNLTPVCYRGDPFRRSSSTSDEIVGSEPR